ncbi:hypothetical protein [Bdellovibrio bacteriovorus]|uniref:Uncharacterized protein n=1 Tax=Bdellovibrio bacteriovorus TaxID=959 RepID=A0A1Z3NC61_BDEBC|nr:hypothetical protein [Bdellovibrio bacteriovorus]ASD65063.1 hypothetical protein B9G79_16550 [Bdellovibrio bacteriovorus]
MKFFVCILVSVFGLSVQAQVLGKIKGSGEMTAKYFRLDGSADVRNVKCTVALNLDQTADVVELGFSFYECEQLGGWNDLPVSLKIDGNKLVNSKGIEQGRIYADGTIEFTSLSRSQVTYHDEKYDGFCRLYSMDKKTLNLDTVIKYTFVKTATGYQMNREVSEDRLAYKSRRDYPRCPAVVIPTAVKMTSSLNAGLK